MTSWNSTATAESHIVPVPALAAMDPGPAPEGHRGRNWFRVYIPTLGLFRYQLWRESWHGQTAPLVKYERGTPFDGWQEGHEERVKLAILHAHGILQ